MTPTDCEPGCMRAPSEQPLQKQVFKGGIEWGCRSTGVPNLKKVVIVIVCVKHQCLFMTLPSGMSFYWTNNRTAQVCIGQLAVGREENINTELNANIRMQTFSRDDFNMHMLSWYNAHHVGATC